ALALAEDVQRFVAGEPVSAHRESLLRRSWRWMRRHRKLLTRSFVVAFFVAALGAGAMMYRNLRAAQARVQARVDVQHVRQACVDARFYAASLDPPTERTPYYDPARGEQSARSALAAAQQWGPCLDHLPLGEEREPLRNELADVCLILAQLRLSNRNAKD